jgi:hypothetical protein
VSIRPGVSVLSLFRHLNYRPWYAIAEFVDNSLQSFLTNRDRLSAVSSKSLTVEIEIDPTAPGRIIVRDNAAGIGAEDYARAFRPADPPPDRSGLAEFGVGMKSAACWFAADWSVRSKALDEQVERTITFDVNQIVASQIDVLFPSERPASKIDHYTEISLTNLHQPIHPATLIRIKKHLASIYRQFERSSTLKIVFNREALSYESPDVLVAAPFRTPAAAPIMWRKDVDIVLGDGITVRGWAAIRAVGSVSLAGFALFRRGRLIEGSGEDTYRPELIFGKSNSYSYQRLFGEFELEGVGVSHTKDGFQWEGHEEAFLDKLRVDLNRPTLPLLAQAEGYRARVQTSDLAKEAQAALESTANALQQFAGPILDGHSVPVKPEHVPQGLPPIAKQNLAGLRELRVVFHAIEWHIRLDLTNEPGVGDWLSVSLPARLAAVVNSGGLARRELSLRMSLAHPFMIQYGGATEEEIEPLIRVGVALGLAEVVAREAGVRNPSSVRDSVNDLLRNALSRAT